MTATDDGTVLLAAILAQPGDDTVRLVYADWLEEHGEEDRASLIRVQVELAKPCPVCDRSGKNTTSPCKCSLLRAREWELWEQGHEDWSEPVFRAFGMELKPSILKNPYRWDNTCTLAETGVAYAHPPGKTSGPSITARFTRGFVSAVTCTAADWLTHRLAIVAAQPIERVTLTECNPVACGPDCVNVIQALRHTTPGIEFTLIPRRGEL